MGCKDLSVYATRDSDKVSERKENNYAQEPT